MSSRSHLSHNDALEDFEDIPFRDRRSKVELVGLVDGGTGLRLMHCPVLTCCRWLTVFRRRCGLHHIVPRAACHDAISEMRQVRWRIPAALLCD